MNPGIRVARVCLETLPDSKFRWTPSGGWALGELQSTAGLAGLWRRPGDPDTSRFEAAYQAFVEAECRDAFLGALAGRSIAWVTPPDILSYAERKLEQLAVAYQLGVRIPRTLVTNSGSQASRFAEQSCGRVVVKPVRYGLVATEPVPLVVWTSEASTKELSALDGVPVILQERVTARSHLRVVTVGSKTFLSELITDELDWRANLQNHENFQPLANELHPDLVDQAQSIATSMGIGFSAQDWIMPATGPPVFLEANPNGQWLFLEDIHKGQIGRELVALLVELGHRTSHEA